MTQHTTIRDFEPEETGRLVEIALAACVPVFSSFRQILGADLFSLVYADWQEEKKEQVLQACRPDSPGTMLVAKRGSTIVGFVGFYADFPRPHMAEIGNNAVHPDLQKQGIAQMMYREVFRRLRKQDTRFVKVATGGDPSHLPARRAYENVVFDIIMPGVEYFRRL